MDMQHPDWGWQQVRPRLWTREIWPKLRDFETMTWAELMRAAGGRRQGNNHHEIDLDNCCKAARERLEELKLDDIASLFSLRLTNTVRIYGIRHGRALRLLWYDRYHSDRGKAVCPVAAR